MCCDRHRLRPDAGGGRVGVRAVRDLLPPSVTVSRFHHVHPVTGAEFDYDRICAMCAFYSERTKAGVVQQCCGMAPHNDGVTFGQVRQAMLACVLFKQHPTRKPKPSKSKAKQRLSDSDG